MSVELIGLLVLALVFVVGTWSSVNLGALALVGAFVVGIDFAGEDLETVLSGFPVDMFLVLFGVTYLFAVAASNGTVDWLVERCSRAVRGNRLLLPLVVFVVSVVPTAFGALGPAIVALLAPVAMRVARQNRLSPQLAGLLVVHGTTAGGFSPLNLGGVIVNGTLAREGIETRPLELFAASFAYNLVLGVVLVLILEIRRSRTASPLPVPESVAAASVSDALVPAVPGAASLVATGSGAAGSGAAGSATSAEQPAASPIPEDEAVPGQQLDPKKTATIVAFVAVAGCALGFGLDIGVLAVVAAVLLQLAFPVSGAPVLSKVSWDVILLICGLLTFVTTLQRIGAVDMLGQAIVGLDSPLLAALLTLALAALVSALASTLGTIGAIVPLSLPLLATGDVTAVGFAIALAICASVVDASPFSTNGALVIAGAPSALQRQTYRLLIRWGAALVVTSPIVTWVCFVVPSS